MRDYRWIFLDADNTLFDFTRSEGEALLQVLRRWGCPSGPEAVAAYKRENERLWERFDQGLVSREWLVVERFRRFLAWAGAPGDPEAMNRAYLDALASLPYLLPGAEEFCARMSARAELVILTNGITAAQTGRLEGSAIRPYISRMFISQDMGCQKPDLEFFRQVFQALGLDPARRQEAVMVGDGLATDVLGGLRAGLKTVWFNPRGLENRTGLHPDWEVGSFQELEAVLLGGKKEEKSRNEANFLSGGAV